jgi:Tol biopolymer transport system component
VTGQRPWIAGVLLAATWLAGGCSGSSVLHEADLPSAPLAIVYRDPETARRRAEALGRDKKETAAGIARIDDVAKLVGRRSVDLFAETSGRLALLDLTTEKVTPLDVAPRGADYPRWSPDHRQLAFVYWKDGTPETHLYDRASGTVRRLQIGDEALVGAAPGPDGRIAVVCVRPRPKPSLRVWVLEVDGGARPVSAGPADGAPAWSPDGSLLVYVQRTEGEGDTIVAIDSDAPAGAPARTLARGNGPAFTPDGAWIVYAATTPHGPRLFKMRPDGSGKLRLGRGVNDDTNEIMPTVSPDGVYVAYVGEGKSPEGKVLSQQLRVRRFDGTADGEVLGEGEASVPSW